VRLCALCGDLNINEYTMKLPLLLCLLLAAAGMFAQNDNVVLRKKLTFPGQTLANVWGYTAAGREYALVGASKGLIIIDITDPDNPEQIVQIPGPDNLWKEIKTYQHYAYVVSEGGQGMQIIDLSNLPSPDLSYHFYTGDGPAAGLDRIHALHVDTTKGFVYTYGGPTLGGGANAFNLNPDPYNPTFAGNFGDLGYVHDGYVDNDTLYAGHIYSGLFSIVDMTDKQNPELLNTMNTPGNFTHNTWLTNDRHTLLTTDEVNNSYLAAYDVSDPSDIKLLDKIQSNPGTYSVVHNTYVLNNFAVSSWYRDGFTIVDITRPGNLVQVGNYDTYASSGSGTAGCWGVYPFFPSGAAIASNIKGQGTNDGELYIVTPNYVRACYVEGQITSAATGLPLQGATIQLFGTAISENSAANGRFAAGQLTAGIFRAQVAKPGYLTVEMDITLESGLVTALDVALAPGGLHVSGQVINSKNQNPVGGIPVWLYGQELSLSGITDANGIFDISGVSPGVYDATASDLVWGAAIMNNLNIVGDTSLVLKLYKDHRRDDSWDSGLSAYPNPFAQSTDIQFDATKSGGQIVLYNALGEIINRFVADEHAGVLHLGDELPSGLYFVRFEQDAVAQETLKLIKL